MKISEKILFLQLDSDWLYERRDSNH